MDNDYLSSRAAAEDWDQWIDNFPKEGDQTGVHIGRVPETVVQCVREARAALFTSMGPGEWRDETDRLAARDQAIDEELAETKTDDLTEGCGLWATISVERAVALTDSTGTRYQWVDWGEAVELEAHFRSDVAEHLDVISAVVASQLGGERVSRVVAYGRRAYFTAPGKGAVVVPEFSAGPATISVGKSWSELPLDVLGGAVTRAPDIPQAEQRELSSASRWLWTALQEKDDLRRFFFAFFGLEILAGKLSRRLKDSVIEKITESSEGLPVKELVWPSQSDQDYPTRNVVFQFAIMAIALSPSTASDDVTMFRTLTKTRHTLAHGGMDDLQDLPVQDCVRLLYRYVSLGASHALSPR